MRIMAGLGLSRGSQKQTKYVNLFATFYFRINTSSHTETHPERTSGQRYLSQTPDTADINTKKQNRSLSAFVVRSQGRSQLYSNWGLISVLLVSIKISYWCVLCVIFFPLALIALCGSVLLMTKGVHFQDSWSGFGMYSAAVLRPRYKPT